MCMCVCMCVCTYHPCGLTTWDAMGPPGAICVGTIKMSVCACVYVCVCVGGASGGGWGHLFSMENSIKATFYLCKHIQPEVKLL